MKNNKSTKSIIESALLVATDPLTLQDIVNLFENDKPSKNNVKNLINELNNSYKKHSFEIVQVASGFRIQVKPGYDEWLTKLNKQSSKVQVLNY